MKGSLPSFCVKLQICFKKKGNQDSSIQLLEGPAFSTNIVPIPPNLIVSLPLKNLA